MLLESCIFPNALAFLTVTVTFSVSVVISILSLFFTADKKISGSVSDNIYFLPDFKSLLFETFVNDSPFTFISLIFFSCSMVFTFNEHPNIPFPVLPVMSIECCSPAITGMFKVEKTNVNINVIDNTKLFNLLFNFPSFVLLVITNIIIVIYDRFIVNEISVQHCFLSLVSSLFGCHDNPFMALSIEIFYRHHSKISS